MTVQINFYHDKFRKKDILLSASRMMTISGITLVTFILIAVFSNWKMTQISHDLEQLRGNYAQLNAKKIAIDSLLKKETSVSALDFQLQKLEAIINNREPLKEILKKGFFKVNHGYSDYMLALARQHIRGMWLTDISMIDAGDNISMSGKSYEPVLLAQYLTKLSSETVLSGTEFQFLSMEREMDENETPERSIGFTISTLHK